MCSGTPKTVVSPSRGEYRSLPRMECLVALVVSGFRMQASRNLGVFLVVLVALVVSRRNTFVCRSVGMAWCRELSQGCRKTIVVIRACYSPTAMNGKTRVLMMVPLATSEPSPE